MDENALGRQGSRRRALLLAACGAAGATSIARAQSSAGMANTLVVYWSRTGNTRLLARQIARANAADLVEIEAAQPYPDDYRDTVAQARRETETGFEPTLKDTLPDVSLYGTVYLGFPIWGMTVPPPIRSFLARHELADKTLVPFITHGGYGTGRSLSVLAQRAPKARIATAFVMKADQERDTLESVTRWLRRKP